MTSAEFKKRLGQLTEVITRGLSYRSIWVSIRYNDKGNTRWSLEEQKEVISRFYGFFGPVTGALADMMIMEFAKVFDNDHRAASLTNLFAAARKDPSLVPRVTAAKLASASRESQKAKAPLAELIRRRKQEIAHADADPGPPGSLLISQFDEVVKCARSGAAFLSTAHCGQALAWDVLDAEWHTSRIVEILVEESRVAKAARIS